MVQNLWDAAKAVIRGNIIAIQSYFKKLEKFQTIILTLHLKQLVKEEQTKSKSSRRKEIIKIRTEINEIEIKETITMINETKSWFFKKINKIDKPVTRLINTKREGTPVNKIRDEKGEATTDTREIQKCVRSHYKQL